ncbi:DUF6449 domain-containing protein [Gracilibacillus sp. HCP3S3_G5_1]|uniref:DUF6449 domain-containing protein n=1 Tax=unclassified Gracilibacillus TaxID=2625209 RepID=UPI003F8A26C4
MPSKTSYFKKELWKQAFRSFGWIGIGYFLALLFLLPLKVIMVKTRNDPGDVNHYQEYVDGLFHINGPVQSILILIVPVLAAMYACRYMHMKGSTDFIHSLPLKRSQLFFHQFTVGYLMILIPVLLTSFILFVMYGLINVDFMYQHEDIWKWFYDTLTFTTFIYSLTFLIGMFTGISVVQGALSYIILIFPYGISLLVMENLRMLLVGFSPDSIVMSYFLHVSPIYWIFELSTQSNLEIVTWYYWLLSIALIGISLVLYQARHMESANQTITFPVIKPIFKFGVTFCFMLLGGTYFGLAQGLYVGWIVFGYICGALLGYLLAEMLLQKTWRVFDQWKGFMIYIGISLFLIVSVIFDWYGFETKVPSKDEVEGIYFANENFLYDSVYYDSDGNRISKQNITDSELIQDVLDLHNFIIANDHIGQNRYHQYTDESTTIDISYHLDNGNKLTREYFIPSIEEIAHYLKPIMESEDYKRSSLFWLYDKNSQINSVAVSGYNSRQQVTDQQTITKIMDAFKQDFLDATYVEMIQSGNREMKALEFGLGPDNFYYVPLLDSYTRVLDVLEEEELDRGLTINSDDVSRIAITRSLENEAVFYELSYMEDIDLNEWMIVNDREQIEELVNLNSDSEGSWEIGFYGPTNDYFIDAYQVREDQLPSYITEYFE